METEGSSRRALLAGATGLVGGHCLDRLLEDPRYETVRVLVRRPTGRRSPKLEELPASFDALESLGEKLRVDDVYCCLGTTIKTAGSEEAFRKVDHGYVLALAKVTRALGARRFGLISSIGAGVGALGFYLRTKGEAERDVSAVGFETLEILQPGLLVGERKEHRPGEVFGIAASKLVAPLMVGPMRPYRPIDAKAVGRALVAAVAKGEPGVHVRQFAELEALAR